MSLDTSPPLRGSIISAVSYEGFTVTTATGEPAKLAILDEDGNVLDAGPAVSAAAWKVVIAAYRQFLQDEGYLRVHTGPPGPPEF
ncbi:MAG TPA: hypothetical protein VF534_01175 [Paraburkholderia sp.]